jgi:hypothetical protein
MTTIIRELGSRKFTTPNLLQQKCFQETICTYAAKAGGSSIQLQAAMGQQTSQMMDRYTTISALHTKHLSDFVDANLLQTSKISESLVGGECEH